MTSVTRSAPFAVGHEQAVFHASSTASARPLPKELSPYREILDALRVAGTDITTIEKVVGQGEYGDLMECLWRLSQRARRGDATCREVLEVAAEAMDVTRTDLTLLLPNLPVSAVRGFVPPTLSGKLMGIQDTGKISWFPNIKEIEVPGTSVYRAAMEAVAPKTAPGPGAVRQMLHDLATIVRDWSDTKTTDARRELRHVMEAAQASGLTAKDMRDLSDDTKRLIVEAANALYGVAFDADTFIGAVREDSSDKPWAERARLWGLDRSADVAKLIETVATSADVFRDPVAWESSRLLLTQSVGITNKRLSARGALRAGTSWYMPSLRELRRGQDKVKLSVSSGFSGAALGVVGVSASANSRGVSMGIKPGWLNFSASEYSQEAGFSIPGLFGFYFGSDAQFGPYFYVSYAATLTTLVGVIPGVGQAAAAAMKSVPGTPYAAAGVLWYHSGFAPIQNMIQPLSKAVSAATTATKAAFARMWRAVTGRPDQQAVKKSWPQDADWKEHRVTFERAQVAKQRAEAVREVLEAMGPELLTTPQARAVLGEDADKPLKTYSTMCRYLDEAIVTMGERITQMRQLANRVVQNEGIDRSALRAAAASLNREERAFQWIYQGLITPLIADPSQAGSAESPAA